MGTVLAITQVGQLPKAWAGPGFASARHPAALRRSGSPSADPTRLLSEEDASGFMLPSAQHPNKETPLFLSAWICLD